MFTLSYENGCTEETNLVQPATQQQAYSNYDSSNLETVFGCMSNHTACNLILNGKEYEKL